MSFEQDFVKTAAANMGGITPIYRSEDVVTKLANSYLSGKDYVRNGRGSEFSVNLLGKDAYHDKFDRPTISYNPMMQPNPLLQSMKQSELYNSSAVGYNLSRDNYRKDASEPMNRN